MKSARIYAFGDSITYGAWDSQGGWCDRLKQKLHSITINSNQENSVKFQMLNLGIGGEDSGALLKRFKFELENRNRNDWPAVVLIGVGANDTRFVEGGQPLVSIDQYRSNLEQILNTAKLYTDKIIFVGVALVEKEILQFKSTILSNELLRKYAQVMFEIANTNNIPIVDVNGGLISSVKPIYFRDGVHLNDAGHKIIANLVWSELEKILNS